MPEEFQEQSSLNLRTENANGNAMTSNGSASNRTSPLLAYGTLSNVITKPYRSIESAFLTRLRRAYDSELGAETANSSGIQELVDRITSNVHESLISRYPQGGHIHIEEIQDNVIARLIDAEQRAVAECYSKYRQRRKEERDSQSLMQTVSEPLVHVITKDGERLPVDWVRLHQHVDEACEGVLDIDDHLIVENIRRNIREGMPEHELRQAMVDTATDMIKVDPNYDTIASRFLLIQLREECLKLLDIPIGGRSFLPETHADLDDAYAVVLKHTLEFGVEKELIDPRLLSYDLTKLGHALVADRDRQFDFHGLQVIYDRYVLQSDGVRFEMPQVFWMRVAMFLAIDEEDREERAIEFYDVLSSFRFISSTPTLFQRRDVSSAAFLLLHLNRRR